MPDPGARPLPPPPTAQPNSHPSSRAPGLWVFLQPGPGQPRVNGCSDLYQAGARDQHVGTQRPHRAKKDFVVFHPLKSHGVLKLQRRRAPHRSHPKDDARQREQAGPAARARTTTGTGVGTGVELDGGLVRAAGSITLAWLSTRRPSFDETAKKPPTAGSRQQQMPGRSRSPQAVPEGRGLRRERARSLRSGRGLRRR